MRAYRHIVLVVLTALFALTGCDGADRDGGQAEARPEIALIMKSLANEFFVTMADGARAHQAAHAGDYDLIVNGIKNESDLAQQVALIDQMIAAGVDAIVIAPADSKAVVPALARAARAGITVINIDNRLDRDVLAEFGLTVPFVGPDNRAGARQVAMHLAASLNPGSPVAILEGIPTAANSRARRAGFEEVATAAGLDVVTIQSANWDQTRAAEITAAILVQHPGLKAILCANDNMALGAASAVDQAGLSAQVRIVGFDNISAIAPLVRDGRVLATADQHADLLAVYGIETALQTLRGTATATDRPTPVDLVTAETLGSGR